MDSPAPRPARSRCAVPGRPARAPPPAPPGGSRRSAPARFGPSARARAPRAAPHPARARRRRPRTAPRSTAAQRSGRCVSPGSTGPPARSGSATTRRVPPPPRTRSGLRLSSTAAAWDPSATCPPGRWQSRHHGRARPAPCRTSRGSETDRSLHPDGGARGLPGTRDRKTRSPAFGTTGPWRGATPVVGRDTGGTRDRSTRSGGSRRRSPHRVGARARRPRLRCGGRRCAGSERTAPGRTLSRRRLAAGASSPPRGVGPDDASHEHGERNDQHGLAQRARVRHHTDEGRGGNVAQ